MVRIGGFILLCFGLMCGSLQAEECQAAIDALNASFQADVQDTAHNVGKILGTPQSQCDLFRQRANAGERQLDLFRKAERACGGGLQAQCGLECRMADLARRKQDAEKTCYEASPEGRAEAERKLNEKMQRDYDKDREKTRPFDDACEDIQKFYVAQVEDQHPELPDLIRRCNAHPDREMCESADKIVQRMRGKHVLSCGS